MCVWPNHNSQWRLTFQTEGPSSYLICWWSRGNIRGGLRTFEPSNEQTENIRPAREELKQFVCCSPRGIDQLSRFANLPCKSPSKLNRIIKLRHQWISRQTNRPRKDSHSDGLYSCGKYSTVLGWRSRFPIALLPCYDQTLNAHC